MENHKTVTTIFTQTFLKGWWNKALRRKVLYKTLNQEDRGYLWLSMRFYDQVKSIAVGRILVKILAKLNKALKNQLTLTIEAYGIGQAFRISRIAVAWEYAHAEEWSTNLGFITFLANNQLNTPWCGI